MDRNTRKKDNIDESEFREYDDDYYQPHSSNNEGALRHNELQMSGDSSSSD
jgi:hypothetical protein